MMYKQEPIIWKLILVNNNQNKISFKKRKKNYMNKNKMNQNKKKEKKKYNKKKNKLK